jgi:Zn finger protein HypA/HybF involved in hydrogenase expression
MHETLMIQELIKQAKSQGEVKSILIELGALAPIEPDHLKTHLQQHVDWDIKIIQKSAKIRCACGYIGKPQIIARTHELVISACPKCSKPPVEIEGDKIILKEVRCA